MAPIRGDTGIYRYALVLTLALSTLTASLQWLIDNGGYLDSIGNKVFSYAHPIFWAPFTLVGGS